LALSGHRAADVLKSVFPGFLVGGYTRAAIVDLNAAVQPKRTFAHLPTDAETSDPAVNAGEPARKYR
jgi:hypothetical protein